MEMVRARTLREILTEDVTVHHDRYESSLYWRGELMARFKGARWVDGARPCRFHPQEHRRPDSGGSGWMNYRIGVCRSCRGRLGCVVGTVKPAARGDF